MRTSCAWTNFFVQHEYVIIQQIKCKNKHRDEMGVQFEEYILITSQYFFIC